MWILLCGTLYIFLDYGFTTLTALHGNQVISRQEEALCWDDTLLFYNDLKNFQQYTTVAFK